MSAQQKRTHITRDELIKHGACSDQVALFVATFGESMPLTKANWRKAQKAQLNIFWAELLLPPAARAEYSKVCAPARAEYNKACAAAWAEYNEACAAALAEYNKVYAPALAEYDKACAAALFDALRVSP